MRLHDLHRVGDAIVGSIVCVDQITVVVIAQQPTLGWRCWRIICTVVHCKAGHQLLACWRSGLVINRTAVLNQACLFQDHGFGLGGEGRQGCPCERNSAGQAVPGYFVVAVVRAFGKAQCVGLHSVSFMEHQAIPAGIALGAQNKVLLRQRQISPERAWDRCNHRTPIEGQSIVVRTNG